MRYCVLYNPKSGGNNGLKEKLASTMFGDDFYYQSMPEITDFRAFFEEVKDNIIICGGDGTLNYFINKIAGIPRRNHLFYFNTGSGNDFHTDVKGGDRPYSIDIYTESLPVVSANGKNFYMINGCGCGIDSYACAEGEKKRAKNHKPVNYAAFVRKGLMGAYKPSKVRVTVDGIVQEYEDAWLSCVMNGKYFGSGVMIAPNQNRLDNRTLTLVVAHTKSRMQGLAIFPSIMKGTHVNNKKVFKILTGSNFKVELERPQPLQIDGEIIPSVKVFEVFSTKH